jgi:hypothetical protein
MDPIGLALDNFDVTGRWRYRENAMPLDTQGSCSTARRVHAVRAHAGAAQAPDAVRSVISPRT